MLQEGDGLLKAEVATEAAPTEKRKKGRKKDVLSARLDQGSEFERERETDRVRESECLCVRREDREGCGVMTH